MSSREDGDMPFRVGFIDQSNTNYEIWLDESSKMNNWSQVVVSGQTGDAPVNKTSIPRINFHSGDAMLMEDELTTCNYDMSECYMMQTIANVDEFDHASGDLQGGQHLFFQGVRLLGVEDTTITIDGVDCAIIEGSLTKEQGECITGANSASTTGVDHVGSSGLRRVIYDSESWIDLDDISG